MMKVVYEEGEIESLERVQKELKEMGRAILFDGSDPDRVYSLNFKITNPGLAEYILVSLLNNKLEDFELGIKITSINLGPVPNKEDIRHKLYEAIDTILQ